MKVPEKIFLALLSFSIVAPLIVVYAHLLSRFAMFRCQDIALRKEYVDLVESVKDSGGDTKIFSSLHVSGERKSYANSLEQTWNTGNFRKSCINLYFQRTEVWFDFQN